MRVDEKEAFTREQPDRKLNLVTVSYPGFSLSRARLSKIGEEIIS